MWKYDEICGMMCGCGDLVFVLLELLELTSHDESKLTQKWQRDSAWQRGSAIGWKRMPPCQLWQAVASCGTVPEANAKDCFIGNTCTIFAIWKGFLRTRQSHYAQIAMHTRF